MITGADSTLGVEASQETFPEMCEGSVEAGIVSRENPGDPRLLMQWEPRADWVVDHANDAGSVE